MARFYTPSELPHFHSTRDTRGRLDLANGTVPGLNPRAVRADRIIYHPGDTAARHYHTGCHHLFYVLSGHGLLHVDDRDCRLAPGMVAVVEPNEIHWFENDTQEDFAFVEFWGPPPVETVWVDAGDV